MSNFSSTVVKVTDVLNHPNADRLSIIKIGDFNCISAKLDDGSHRYNIGDLVVYIQESSLLPQWMLKKMGFWNDEKQRGTLSGSSYNRVKACQLRGILSRGVLYPSLIINNDHYIEVYNDARIGLNNLHKVHEDQDVSEILGIDKYIPPIPTHMSGEVCSIDGQSFHYDIENYEKNPTVFSSDDTIVATSKRHGTFCALGFLTKYFNKELYDCNKFASSKGFFGKGLAFKHNGNNVGNLYHKTLFSKNNRGINITSVLEDLSFAYNKQSVYIIGEIFGNGVQDLKYNLQQPVFEVFDIYVGSPPMGRFLNDDELQTVCDTILHLNRVPVLYRGNFDLGILQKLRDDNDMMNGNYIDQIREGLVIKTTIESRNDIIGRKQLKMISPNYLLRKNKDATEFN